MGVIYCFINKINGKKYIGQTINPNQRYKQHKSSAFNKTDKEYNSLFHRAIRKYGWNNFDYKILQTAKTIEELNRLEIFYIANLNSQTPKGYNIESGGKNFSRIWSEEEKVKLSNSHASLSEEEIIYLRKAYLNKESPSKIYNAIYKEKMHYNSFLNIWSGRRYKHIMPEVFNNRSHIKATSEMVIAIRKDRKELNLSYDKLAEKYKISKSTVADIVKFRTWKNVQEPVSTSLESET